MIRPYMPEDLATIMDIGNRAWRGIHKMFREIYGEELLRVIYADTATVKGEQIKLHCQTHPEWVYICEEGGRIVGFITFHLDQEKRIGKFGNNAVDPRCGLKGIGQQMYQAVLGYFRDQGMTFATVATGADHAHAPARKAYERAGFNIRHERVAYFMKL